MPSIRDLLFLTKTQWVKPLRSTHPHHVKHSPKPLHLLKVGGNRPPKQIFGVSVASANSLAVTMDRSSKYAVRMTANNLQRMA
eukprot:5850470-Amphidinium_carterae.2